MTARFTILLLLAAPTAISADGVGDIVPPTLIPDDLRQPVVGSNVLELTEDSLREEAGRQPLLIVWFYAPWCKQCKLFRGAFETAAARGVPGATFARIDCDRFKAAKAEYGVNSYPALKAVRGGRSRFIQLPRDRTDQMITAAVAAETEGAYRLVTTADELRSMVFEQELLRGGGGTPDKPDHALSAGVGEAAVVALLSAADGEAAAVFERLAAGCDIRLSFTPFVAVVDAALLAEVGLVPLQPDAIGVVQLYAAAADAVRVVDGHVRRSAPPTETAPLVAGAGAEKALDTFVRAYRLPLLVDFGSDPYWGKRAAAFSHLLVHALIFHHTADGAAQPTAPEVVRSAAAAFERGSAVVLHFNLADGDDAIPPSFLEKYGVYGVADVPRLVLLDQRLPTGSNRQVPYAGAMAEAPIRAFLESKGLPLAVAAGQPAGDALKKDEL